MTDFDKTTFWTDKERFECATQSIRFFADAIYDCAIHGYIDRAEDYCYEIERLVYLMRTGKFLQERR